MKKMRLLSISLLCLFASSSYGSERVNSTWLIVSTNGRDAEGTSLFDRFEITPDGLAKWQSSSVGVTGSICTNGAGRFQGKVDKEKAEKVVSIAAEALDGQPASEGESPEESRSSSISIMLSSEGKTRSGMILASTSDWTRLVEEIRSLRSELEPKTLVVMTATRKEKKLEVTFTLVGDRNVTLQLPHDASEAFRVEGQMLSFPKPQKTSEIELSPKARSKKVALRLSTLPTSGQELRYSNSVILHHAKEDSPLEKVRQELTLCTGF